MKLRDLSIEDERGQIDLFHDPMHWRMTEIATELLDALAVAIPALQEIERDPRSQYLPGIARRALDTEIGGGQ